MGVIHLKIKGKRYALCGTKAGNSTNIVDVVTCKSCLRIVRKKETKRSLPHIGARVR